jgi:lysophospholipase L1-like esterase
MKSRITRPAAVLLAIALAPLCGCTKRMPSTSNGDAGAPGPTALVHRVGRFDTRDPAGPRFAWPATALEATFTGDGLDVRLRDAWTNVFAVAIDGGTPTVLSTNRATEQYTLASALPAGRHTVTLTKRTESNQGVVQFLGFVPHDGTLIATPEPAPKRRIEFVGDSVTCGYGDLGTDPSQHFSPETEDEGTAYGALTAIALGAQRSVIAYSGIGMIRSNEGSTIDPMPVRFRRTLADDPTSSWAFSDRAPDVVVVNLGTNDFARGDPGSAFQRRYVDFLQTLRGLYPETTLVGALSPMLTDAYPAGEMQRTKATAYIRGAVDERRSAGDRRVSYFEFAEQRLSDGFGSDYHPNAATHRRMATQLVDALRALMGW